jgi:hypothetical protein
MKKTPDALGADQPHHLLHLVQQRLARVVEQQVRFVQEEDQLRPVHVAHLGELVVEAGQHPEHEGAEERGPVLHVLQLQHAHAAAPVGLHLHQVVQVELRLAKEVLGALLLQLDHLAQQHADGGLRHAAVLRQLVRAVAGEVLQDGAQVGKSRRSSPLSSQYLKTRLSTLVCVALSPSTLARSTGPNDETVARSCAPCFPVRLRNSTGAATGRHAKPVSAAREDTRSLVSPGAPIPERSPFTSDRKTGTPAAESCSAMSCSVLVFPCPWRRR